MAISATGSEAGRLFNIPDRSSSVKYTINTDAQIGLIPVPPSQHDLHITILTLRAANGTPIKTYGQKPLTLDLVLRRCFL